MEKIPCIECNSELWEYIKPFLEKWGYKSGVIVAFDIYPIIVLNRDGKIGICTNDYIYNATQYNRELITNVEEFLQRAAELKGFTYKRKDTMKINGVEIKPGMIITVENGTNYIAFPTSKGITFVNNENGGWGSVIPENIVMIKDLITDGHIYSGKTLWKKPEEVIITMDQIAEKFGISVEQLRIKK